MTMAFQFIFKQNIFINIHNMYSKQKIKGKTTDGIKSVNEVKFWWKEKVSRLSYHKRLLWNTERKKKKKSVTSELLNYLADF